MCKKKIAESFLELHDFIVAEVTTKQVTGVAINRAGDNDQQGGQKQLSRNRANVSHCKIKKSTKY